MSEVGERFGVNKFLTAFIKKVAKDFNIEPPKVIVLEPTKINQYCRATWRVAGCYRHPEETIYVNESILLEPGDFPVEALLHEFAHHMQYIRAGKDAEKAFPLEDFSKPHCEKRHEREAKDFEKFYKEKYKDLFDKGFTFITSLYNLCSWRCAEAIINSKSILEELLEMREFDAHELIRRLSEKGQVDTLYMNYLRACVNKEFEKPECRNYILNKEYLEELKRILEQLE